MKSSALAHPNIALIKYWGNRAERIRLPANGSISMNLDGLSTCTQVVFENGLTQDMLTINKKNVIGAGFQRVAAFLDEIRRMAGIKTRAEVVSENNFPAGAGIASSASAFAALALAASKASGLDLSEAQLSRLARLGSGSACRSVPGGFVEWKMGTGDADSFAESIAPAGYWDLVDCIAIVSTKRKTTGSTKGHALAGTSPLQAARVADAPRRLEICRSAILNRDFDPLAKIVELDSNLMHAVMMTSHPQLFYWQPSTLAIMQAVREMRAKGLPVCTTIDAGPNVHVITEGVEAGKIAELLGAVPGVQKVLVTRIGGPARLVNE